MRSLSTTNCPKPLLKAGPQTSLWMSVASSTRRIPGGRHRPGRRRRRAAPPLPMVAESLLPSPPFDARSTEDHAELRRCQLKESQYLIACTIHDLQHPSPSSPLPPQFLLASPQLLRGLQADLARVNQQLQQDQLVPASPAAEGREH